MNKRVVIGLDSRMLAPAILLIMAAGLVAGCTDRVEESMDPDLTMEVLEVTTKGKSPAPTAENASLDNEFLYVKVNITNGNEKANHHINGAGSFSVDNNDNTVIHGSDLANIDMRSIDSLVLQEGEGKTFWVVFEVPEDDKMIYIRYDGGLDEPLDSEIGDYQHFSGDV